jgi:hypothetical protein
MATPEASRIIEKLKWLPPFWAATRACLPGHPIVEISPSARVLTWFLSYHPFFCELRASQFFSFARNPYVNLPGTPDAFEPDDPLKDRLVAGIKDKGINYLCAGTVTVLLKHCLEHGYLQDDDDIKRVDWCGIIAQPEYVLFEASWPLKLPSEHHRPVHNVVVVTSASNTQYVVDLTGAQFGFEGWFHSMQVYQALYMHRTSPCVFPSLPREYRARKNELPSRSSFLILFLWQLANEAVPYAREVAEREIANGTPMAEGLTVEELEKKAITQLFCKAIPHALAFNNAEGTRVVVFPDYWDWIPSFEEFLQQGSGGEVGSGEGEEEDEDYDEDDSESEDSMDYDSISESEDESGEDEE